MRRLALSLLTIIAVASLAWSQPQVYLGGGIAFPTAPQAFKDDYKMGYNLGGGIGFSLSPTVSYMLTVGYASFPFDVSGINARYGIPSGATVSVDGGTVSGLDVLGDFKFSLMPKGVSVYLIAGVGYFNMSMSDATVKVSYQGHSSSTTVSSDSKSAFCASGGAGVDVPVSGKIGVFVEGRYFIAFTSGGNTSYVPVKAGVRIRF